MGQGKYWKYQKCRTFKGVWFFFFFLSWTTVTESDIYFFEASKPWSYFRFEMRLLDYKKELLFFIEVDGSPFISLIFDSDYPGPQSRGLGRRSGKKKRIETDFVHCPRKYYLLSRRTPLCLEEWIRIYQSLGHMELKKLMERLSVGFSLLIGKFYKGMELITVFSVDIWSQLVKGIIYVFKKPDNVMCY